jgi:hypothetical protein
MNLINRPPTGDARDIEVYNMLDAGGDEKRGVIENVIRTEPDNKGAGKVREKKRSPKNMSGIFCKFSIILLLIF